MACANARLMMRSRLRRRLWRVLERAAGAGARMRVPFGRCTPAQLLHRAGALETHRAAESPACLPPEFRQKAAVDSGRAARAIADQSDAGAGGADVWSGGAAGRGGGFRGRAPGPERAGGGAAAPTVPQRGAAEHSGASGQLGFCRRPPPPPAARCCLHLGSSPDCRLPLHPPLGAGAQHFGAARGVWSVWGEPAGLACGSCGAGPRCRLRAAGKSSGRVLNQAPGLPTPPPGARRLRL